jgi:hypothetical protein
VRLLGVEGKLEQERNSEQNGGLLHRKDCSQDGARRCQGCSSRRVAGVSCGIMTRRS